MSEHEELIEEIQDIYKAGMERRTPNMSPQQLITRILSAVEDGTLPLRKVPKKLRGELSRDVTGDDQLIIIVGASQGMALRPLTGTGKEKE